MGKYYTKQPGHSDMHKRRKFTLNHTDTAIIDTALENLAELFKKNKDFEYQKKAEKTRMSLIHQEQEHWNKEHGYPKGFGYKVDINGKKYRGRKRK